MKAKPMRLSGNVYTPCEPHEATHIMLHFPGTIPNRILPVSIGEKRPECWQWNGDVERPTITPSILTRSGTRSWDEATEEYRPIEHVCHSIVSNGWAEFCSDSTHKHAGQIVELLDVDY